MKVLIVHDYAARFGGGEHMALGLRESLRSRGHECRLFASRAELVEGVEREADATCFGTTGPLLRVTQALNPMAAAALRKEIATFRPDVVHVRMFLSQLSPLILPELRRAKKEFDTRSLLHVVNPDLFCPIGTKTLPDGTPCHRKVGVACHEEGCLPWLGVARAVVQHGLTRRWLDVFDRIVTNSQYMRDRIREEGLRCDGYVWNGIREVPQRPPLQERSTPTVAFAGRLHKTKGVDVLVRAMPAVREAVPAARLVVAGDGPELAKLRALAADLGVAAAVDFAGHLTRDELETLFAAVWVQAVPSTWEEPFGIACAEAMMRGSAVVATDSGGLAEQVVAGETGLLRPAGDVAGWADALASLLGDRGRCERMGTAGRDRAQRLFGQERFVDEFVKIYDELLANRQ